MTELNFKGKEFVYNHHLAVPFRPLITHPDKGIGESALDDNLIIHGDNLHALKSLLPIYAGKVDCVFIDPPYNTGNEGWCYNDNVNAPMIKEWLESNPVGIEDGLRHDKWCALMWPRLRLLHELLADTGSIWITLDDNELHRARLILDEIFGEEEFICTIAIQSNKRGQTYKQVSKTHEHMLVYSKTNSNELNEIATEGSNLPNRDEFGPYSTRELRNRNPKFGRYNRPNLYYPFYVSDQHKDSDGNLILYLSDFDGAQSIFPMNSTGAESCWRWSQAKACSNIQNESTRHIFGTRNNNGELRVMEKYRKQSVKAKTIWAENKHILEQGTKELGRLGLAESFQFPKPLGIVEDVLKLATDANGIVLDSFAGSGTTAHAVMNLNHQDRGNRRFVLIEMEDYADCLTAERVRRVINGYEYFGTQRRELFRKKLTWSSLKNANKILESVQGIKNLHAHEFDEIECTAIDGELIVTGNTTVDSRVDGFGGTFTYCSLGEPVELDQMLQGRDLPPFADLGGILFHMATNHVINPADQSDEEFFLGELNGQCIWLIYKPDLSWLGSPEAALTLRRAKDIAATAPEKRHLVFAAARYVSDNLLSENKLPVEFVSLPFALYRIDRS